ncbi:hypothetical protein ACRYI5_01305 [Furfurilactobacillus sp. WILCCON 0119]
MAQDLAVDENGDLIVGNDIALVTDDEELRQHVWTIIKSQRGSDPLDETAGTDLFSVFGGRLDQAAVASVIKTAVLTQEPQISDVTLTTATLNPVTRALSMAVVFQKQDGTSIEVSGVLND